MNRSLTDRVDPYLVSITIMLLVVGLANLYSASLRETISDTPIYIKQTYWALVGLAAMTAVIFIEYRTIRRFAYVIYGANLALLVAVLFLGGGAGGAHRWFVLGPVSFQPSEFMKLSCILAVSSYFASVTGPEGLRIRDLLVPAAMTAVPAALIVMEPDLGSAGLLVLLFLTMICMIRMRPRTYMALAVTTLVCAPPVVFFGWRYLKPYQRQRIITFLNPESDPLGSGYHIIQSKIAVGSGQLFGKGYLAGTQGQLKFLPEQHTDFIFSVLAEEWGFIGGLVFLGLVLAYVVRGTVISREAKDMFTSITAMGITVLFLWQSFINIAMAVGLFPVVGIPLPFLSYGGSSLVTTLLGTGMLLNIHMRRRVF
ncbi:MAG: rod shape-determining protein RodA [Deltaproteobacteria bacterium]|nr:rod shape-determining protein RodA [Candidatus Zymogenaceae bacterium]